MADQETIDLSEGGIAVVVLSSDFNLPADYDLHPQVRPLSLDQVDGKVEDTDKKFPLNTKIVLLSDGIPGLIYQNLQAIFRRRGIVFLHRKNQTAIEDALKELNLPLASKSNGGPKPDGKKPPKGSVKEFVEKHADLRCSSNAVEARRVFRLAQEQGIITTIGSVTQIITNAKRHKNMGGKPQSLMSRQEQALKVLDDAIENLALIRDYVAETEQKSFDLEKRLKRVQEAMGK